MISPYSSLHCQPFSSYWYFPLLLKIISNQPITKNLHLIKKTFLTNIPLLFYPLYKIMTEKIVRNTYCTSNSLLNLFQSAYTKYYFTETTLLSLQDHLTNAFCHQPCLCLLELSAAFETLDHSILVHHLYTWFGTFQLPLQWFTSYLSSRISVVFSTPHLSPSQPLTRGVQQGSVLAPTPFPPFLSYSNLYPQDPVYVKFSTATHHCP